MAKKTTRKIKTKEKIRRAARKQKQEKKPSAFPRKQKEGRALPIKPARDFVLARRPSSEIIESSAQKEKRGKYYEARGARKTAVARVRLWTKGEKEFFVNGKHLSQYFPIPELQQTALASLRKMNVEGKFRIEVKVGGGGISAQAEAIRHGIARALVLFNPDFKKRLRKAGYLTRDPRMRERKKFGLKRARRAPQWAKR